MAENYKQVGSYDALRRSGGADTCDTSQDGSCDAAKVARIKKTKDPAYPYELWIDGQYVNSFEFPEDARNEAEDLGATRIEG